MKRIKGTLHEYQCTFIISRRILLRIKYIAKNFVDEIKTQILCSIAVFFPRKSSVYDVVWKNVIGLARPQTTIGRTHFACWITETKNAHSEYVTIIASPLQRWLHEGAVVTLYVH